DTLCPRLVRTGAGEGRQGDQADQDNSDDCEGSAHRVSTSCKDRAPPKVSVPQRGRCRRATKASALPTSSSGRWGLCLRRISLFWARNTGPFRTLILMATRSVIVCTVLFSAGLSTPALYAQVTDDVYGE